VQKRCGAQSQGVGGSTKHARAGRNVRHVPMGRSAKHVRRGRSTKHVCTRSRATLSVADHSHEGTHVGAHVGCFAMGIPGAQLKACASSAFRAPASSVSTA